MSRQNIISDDRSFDFISTILLVILVSTAYGRLVATRWTDHLTITSTISYLALIIGLAIGYSRFSTRTAVFFFFAYAIFIIPWQLGLTLGNDIPWLSRLTIIASRLWLTITFLLHNKPVPDNLFFLLLMSILYWIMCAHAGYALTRHGAPWDIIIPIGLCLVIIHSYDNYILSRSWYLAVYLFFALLLIARLVYLKAYRLWQKTNTYTPPHLGLDYIRYAAIITLVLCLFALATPTNANAVQVFNTAWEKIKQPFHSMRESIGNAFAPLKPSYYLIYEYYGSSLALGRGNQLSDKTIFTVIAPYDVPAGTRFYWKSRVYGTYQLGMWKSSSATSYYFTPMRSQLKFPLESKRPLGLYTFYFTPEETISVLNTVAQTHWVNVQSTFELTNNPDGTVDIGAFRATTAIHQGQTYTIRSSLSAATTTEMQLAGQDYPQWVKDNYLHIPASITPRTISLAQEITAGQETPYEKVVAITNYLRSHIEYVEKVPEPPKDQEPIDWFLFDYKKGFCNYYASAEVILLRAVGIPARLAVGYAEGEYHETGNLFIIRQRDAHAWPEVYFPDLGWVEFEPTVSQAALIRPAGQLAPNSNPEETSPSDAELRRRKLEEFNPRSANNPHLVEPRPLYERFIIIIPILLLLFADIWKLSETFLSQERIVSFPLWLEKNIIRTGLTPPAFIRNWVLHVSLNSMDKAYQAINTGLERMGIHPAPTVTPSERAVALIEVVPELRDETQLLLHEYQLYQYSPQDGDIPIAQQAARKINHLTRQAQIRRITAIFRR